MQENRDRNHTQAPYAALSIEDVEDEHQSTQPQRSIVFPGFFSQLLIGHKYIIGVGLACILYAILLLIFSNPNTTTPDLTTKRPPHIVFVMSDDMGWNDYSIHGSKQCNTPHIDRLSNSGVILNNYYVTSVCSPSRASFLTGRIISHTGIYSPLGGHETVSLNTSLPLLPKVYSKKEN